MANPTVTPIMTPARGPGGPDAQPIYLVDVWGNPIQGTEPNISVAIRNGQGYMVGTGAATATNPSLTVCALSLFNAASGKSVLIYSIRVPAAANNYSLANAVRQTTVDPTGTTGFTAVPTIFNMKPGGVGSVVSACASPTAIAASITATGTVMFYYAVPGLQEVELLSNGAVLLLPAGSANGLEITTLVATAGNNFGATARYIEF